MDDKLQSSMIAASQVGLVCMQIRSILLTSGTLSPLDSFAHELALPFPVRLENPHVIAREQASWQICVGTTTNVLLKGCVKAMLRHAVGEPPRLANLLMCCSLQAVSQDRISTWRLHEMCDYP
jgi:hypothetical protein